VVRHARALLAEARADAAPRVVAAPERVP
jgi:hypothetical protein